MRPVHVPMFRLTLPAVAISLLLAPAAGADTVRRQFEVAPGGTLDLESDLGSIEVATAAGSRVVIEVERSGSAVERLDLAFDHRGDDVTVRGSWPESSRSIRWGRGDRVRYKVTVPARYDLHLATHGGSISVADLEGEVRAATSGGSLSFGDIRGPVHGRTSGGSIRLAGGRGDADVKTSGGSISIGTVDGRVAAETSGGSIQIAGARGSVRAETSGGSIQVDEVRGAIEAETSGGGITARITEQPAGDCRLVTSGGGITVELGRGIGVDLDARASGGGVTSELPVEGGSKSKAALSGRIGGGGPALVLRTSGGGVRVKKG